MMNNKEQDKKYIANTYGRFDIEIVRGEGSVVYDEHGKRYIDMGTGIAVNTFGVSDKEWCKAISEQLEKCQHTSNLYYSEPCIRLASMLCERTGARKVFFGNSGAEANECAIKVARKWAKDVKGEGDYTVITLKNSFHGRTITTLKATGQDVFHTDFGPFPEGFVYAEANNIDSIKELINDKCCAVMIELVQGEGGVMALDIDFVKSLEELCRENELLLIIDEVQTGNGRTGSLYAYMQYGISPDIVTTAKGLGGGLPLGATLLYEKTEKTLTPGSHGSTFGGNPIACAGAVNILSRIDEKLLSDVKKKSEYILHELANAEGVKSVSGMGLMIGIETVPDVSLVISECQKRGVLPIKAKNKLRLLPALNISEEELCEAVTVIKGVIKDLL